MLRFTGSALHAVLAEAGTNGCRLILVKDHGVYLMSEIGENKPDGGGRQHVVYAAGCDPYVDDFDFGGIAHKMNWVAMILSSTSTSTIRYWQVFTGQQGRWWWRQLPPTCI